MKRFVLFTVLCFAAGFLFAQAGTILKSDFEDGTGGGWVNRGPVSLKADAGGAHTGKFGLLTTGRTAGWNGPSVDLTGKTALTGAYSFSAWVKIREGQPDSDLIMTVQREKGGTQGWDRVTQVNAKAGTWVNLTGTWEPKAEFDKALMYIESSNVTLEYYIDDITMNVTKEPQKAVAAAAPVPSAGLNSDFEDGKTGDWVSRGSVVLKVVAEGAHAGKFGLFATGRTANWHGPSVDLTGKVAFTGSYAFSAWVKIREGRPDSDIIMTVQREKAGTQAWDRVALVGAKAGVWVNVAGTWEPKEAFDKALMYIEAPVADLEYYVDDVTMKAVKEPQKTVTAAGTNLGLTVPSIAAAYGKNFIVGAAVEPNQLSGSEGQLFLRHFSGLTAENAMKPQYISPSEGVYNFDTADKLVDFAVKNNLKMRGHTLQWHTQNARWMYYDANGRFVSKDVLLKRLDDYIATVVGRYKGKVYAWDVVNEVVDGAGMRNSEWYQIAGEEYVERAFLAARKADPAAKLFINEFGEFDQVKRNTLYQLVKKLKAKGIPVDGIGMQFHISIQYPSLDAIRDTLKLFSDLGVEIHVTELDMSLNADPNVTAGDAPESLLVRQGHRYKEIFEIFKSFPAVRNVTLWGFHDGHTWLTGHPVRKADWPLPFDANFNPKHAYWGLVDPSKLPVDVALAMNRNTFSAVAPKGTPKIDGVEEAMWQKAQDMKINIFVDGKGATGVGKALWDDRNLYVLVKVADKLLSKKSLNAWEQDTVEIFVDEKNDKTVDFKADDVQYRINYENALSVNGTNAGIVSKAVVTKDGYMIEAMIPLRFAKAAEGTAIGFDLQINDDSTGSGVRDSYSKWNDPTNESYRNTSGWGTLVFGK